MGRVAHASCGYSALAPGCAGELCLLHRIDVGTSRGWDVSSLQARLDAVIEDALAMLIVEAGQRAAEREPQR